MVPKDGWCIRVVRARCGGIPVLVVVRGLSSVPAHHEHHGDHAYRAREDNGRSKRWAEIDSGDHQDDEDDGGGDRHMLDVLLHVFHDYPFTSTARRPGVGCLDGPTTTVTREDGDGVRNQ